MVKTIAPLAFSSCLFLAVAALALSVASADEANKDGKDGLVREIDLAGFTRSSTSGVATKPTKITSAEELAKAIPDTDNEWRDRIAKQVDFEKEELLFFAWTGSATDSLSVKVEVTKHGPVAVFSFKPGLGEDKPHPRFRLYAIARNWRVESPREKASGF